MFKGNETATVCNGTLLGNPEACALCVSTDSRTVNENDMFFALSGNNFDGNSYASAAFEKGASICVVSREITPPAGKCSVLVEDTGKAFLLLAAYHRKKFNIPVIGITGSVGKTTTKEFLASALSSKLKVLKTLGNFNNEVGLPKTLLRLDSTHDAAVVEMGMNHAGELSRLTRTASPDIALITNIGVTHIENLGSQENILKAKLEILEGLPLDGKVVLNADDPYLSSLDLPYKTVFYGLDTPCEFRGEVINNRTVRFRETTFVLPVEGRHNLQNVMAAVATASLLGLDETDAAKGIAEFYRPDGKRQTEITHENGFTVICDFYNSSPTSLAASLAVLGEKKGRKIAVLGDMLELGEFSAQFHRDAGTAAAKNGIDILFCIGDASSETADAAKNAGVPVCAHFTSKDELSSELKKTLCAGDYVLIKGSRGMKMEDIYEKIMG